MKTLMVTDSQMCSECEDCINACEKEHGTARVIKSATIPIFCMHCHPDKAPCLKICPAAAFDEFDGILKVNEKDCIMCRLCLIACPIGLIVFDKEENSAEKCTLCLESDRIIPACVESCKDNALKLFSIEELHKLKNDTDIALHLEEAIKTFNGRD